MTDPNVTTFSILHHVENNIAKTRKTPVTIGPSLILMLISYQL